MSSDDQRPTLTRQRVLQAAVDFADRHGLDALSMRKLAAELGFEVMALYNHVRNKPDLIRGMTDLVAEELPLPAVEDSLAALRAHCIELRQVLESHPWAAMCWATTLPGPARWAVMEWQLETVSTIDGLTEEQAHHGYHALTNHVVGYVLQNAVMPFSEADFDDIVATIRQELSPETHRRVLHHIDQHAHGEHGESFEHVLDLILGGLGAIGT
jgi:AcrR family transcriptional regulator